MKTYLYIQSLTKSKNLLLTSETTPVDLTKTEKNLIILLKIIIKFRIYFIIVYKTESTI